MRGVRKRFGATVALDGVDLTVRSGEVHALVGENGAGKSTLMKVLSGAIRPDAGTMTLFGAPYRPHSPQTARAAGVSIVYQELNLATHLTVEQNITLGIERHAAGVIRPGAHRRRIAEVLGWLDQPELVPWLQVRRLSPAGRQLVEIARALVTDARVLILDEPTSSLGLADIARLFAVIRRLKSENVAIVYISHFLEEIQNIADYYTVLRDGRTVAGGPMHATTPAGLVEQMIGRRLDDLFPRVPHAVGTPLLHVQQSTGGTNAADVTLHRGEILGLAGLVGSGRSELLRAIFGLRHDRKSRLRVAHLSGARRNEPAISPARALRAGRGLLSEDRQSEGLALARSLADNLTLSRLGPLAFAGWLNPRRVARAARDWIGRLNIRTRGPEQRVADLSGGNQQKVALARLLHHDVDILMLDEPTRGVDVASKAQIFELMGRCAAAGKAILLVSSSFPELLGVCDRIAVMYRGRLSASRPAHEWTEHSLIAAAASGRETA
ncbi:MAG: Ribose import ATP-binding protein RbsA [Phycisphaerae bacterium]|nr:Ribose import ATP-binding protein RbsA [Phycisphaerae bacterium]